MHDDTPILVGTGRLTRREASEDGCEPIAMMQEAARRAARDCGAHRSGVLRDADCVAVVDITLNNGDLPERLGFGGYSNPPRSLARALGCAPRHELYTHTGGNSPQMLVNHVAEAIADGEVRLAILAGAEVLHAALALLKDSASLSWGDDPGGTPLRLGTDRAGTNEVEDAHGLKDMPRNVYPLFENALRARAGQGVAEHMQHVGELFSPLSKIAAQYPEEAWFPTYRTPAEIATPTEHNRLVGFPYTKYMNAVMRVNMAASLIMTSVAHARRLGIDPDRWIFLHGCADSADHWYVSERRDFYSSPAIGAAGKRALDMAQLGLGDIGSFDLYSCFPSVVQIGCEELGLATDDPRGLTVVGGLPYYGGPGSNYTMHSIGIMMERLRARPDSFGLVTANGWYVTKHSIGIYSTRPWRGRWQRDDPARDQRMLDAMPRAAFSRTPHGPAHIETYTVAHGRGGPERGIVVGRLPAGERFIANTPSDPDSLKDLMAVEGVGRAGYVRSERGHNTFFAAR